MYKLLVGIFGLCVACGPRMAHDGPPIETGVSPVPPEAPLADAGCVPAPEAAAFGREQKSYFAELKAQAAARRGWRILEAPAVVHEVSNSEVPGFDFIAKDVHLKRVGEGRMVDLSGQHWLKVGETDLCVGTLGEFAIDAKAGVFEVESFMRCESERELRVCGHLPRGGCGTQPPPDMRKLWFVKVPEHAKLVLSPEDRLEFSSPICVVLNPVDGFVHPP